MDEKTLELLEFQRIQETLAGYALSPGGSRRVMEKHFFTEERDLSDYLDLVDSFKNRLRLEDPFPRVSFPDLEPLLPRIRKEGAVLEGKELADLALYLESAGKLKRFIQSDKRFPLLIKEGEDIPDLSGLAKAIFKVIDGEGNVKDQEIPELRNLKKRISSLQQDLERISSSYLRDKPSLFQTDLAGFKEGRIVLPLKANHRGKIQGIIQEVSASGATLYIEPLDLLEKNNEAALLQNRYRQAVLKVLRETTALAVREAETISYLFDRVNSLDALYARSRYSEIHRCFRAKLDSKEMRLVQARHPLLGSSAVPIDLYLSQERKMMLITGPNTGGKTVSLKTAGLLSLINQSGSHIPAAEGSLLPVFDNILADIGDEQSIDQSLSTFSGHMKRITGILLSASRRSLVLLDELGGGTDPEEGAALGMSILDSFLKIGSFLITTTHNGAMKIYGFTKEGAFNASVAFDSVNLVPTYKLLHDLPGESHALEIAERNGLPREIINLAREYQREHKTDLSGLISELSTKIHNLNIAEGELKEKEKDFQEKLRIQELYHLKVKQKEKILKEQGYRELDTFLKESRRYLENLVKDIREGELNREKTKNVKGFLENLEVRVNREETELSQELEDPKETTEETRAVLEPEKQIEPGVEVLVGKERRRGKVLRKSKKDSWIVAIENIRLTVKAEEMIPLKQRKEKLKPVLSYPIFTETPQASFEIDLRGKRLEEALSQLEKQIDRAILSGMREFHIIHGMGEGILQRGIHQYLRSCRNVSDYFFAHPDMGGFGKTIVMLDKR